MYSRLVGNLIAYVFPNDGPKTTDPQYTDSGDLIYEKALAGKHGFTKALSLVILDNTCI